MSTEAPIRLPPHRRLGRRAHAGILLLLALAWGAPLAGVGCQRAPRPGAEPLRVDRSLMACLGALRAYHRQADVHLASGDPHAAIRSIEQILELPCIGRRNPEIQETVLDAYARLGRLHLKLGELAAAARQVQDGLARSGPPSFFRANLLMVHGDVLDAQAQALDKTGDKAKANHLRREAIAAFDQSARMNKQLLEEITR